MKIKITGSRKPDAWYAHLIGKTFDAEAALIGYKISKGFYEGHKVMQSDCEVIPVSRRQTSGKVS